MDELTERRSRKQAARLDRDALNEVAEYVGSTVGDVLVSVRGLGQAVERLVEEIDGGRDAATRADVETLHPLIENLIERHTGLLVGAGFVADPDFLNDVAHWLDWRLLKEDGYGTMEVTLDANDVANYDYINTEWFRIPKQGAPSAIIGPYVDLGGTNAYVVTITVPVRVDGDFLGVVGADISVDRIEGVLRRLTRKVGLAAMVVTGEGRVIASSVPRQCPGTLLRNLKLNDREGVKSAKGLAVYECRDLPWRLVVLGCEDPGDCALECGACSGL
jgi:hypothetical protein